MTVLTGNKKGEQSWPLLLSFLTGFIVQYLIPEHTQKLNAHNLQLLPVVIAIG